MQRRFGLILVAALGLLAQRAIAYQTMTVGGWQLQDASKVDANGEQISQPAFQPHGWYKAVVPGTVLTTLVEAGVYPEPLYGENNRKIPESLAHSSYWYRTTLRLPSRGAHEHDWIRFNGINYLAEVFVNGHDLGPIKGAFVRGEFDISPYAGGGGTAAIAVHVYPPPHPGQVLEQTVANGTGRNGGAMGQDGATFVATVGWDWMPGIRDRDTGLWQSVETFRTGPVRIRDPYVTTDFDVQNPVRATVSVEVTVQNLEQIPQDVGTFVARLGGDLPSPPFHFTFVRLAPSQTRLIKLPNAVINHPKLWWPNGYGESNLYNLILATTTGGAQSDELHTRFGIKKYDYFLTGSKNLGVIVNGVPIFCKGGNWGMDEAMKRIPYKRMDAEMRMHRDAHCTMIRNWVGQSTEEEFYDLCDKYGLMVWDDFWLANPADGPIPNDNELFMRNAREKVLRYRNHPSIAIWCGRNEANPPPILNTGLKNLIAELDPQRFYQPHSAAINGVGGGGPYAARPVPTYFNVTDGLHTEIGLPSIPTIESIEGMMPKKDWSPDWKKLNDDWAEHDLTRGAQDGQMYPRNIAKRFGPISNLADFVRKSQLENYDGYRAVFEGRNSKLFNPAKGVLLWMSSPAQPSFVWQLYHYDLDPTAALFGTETACEPIHPQYNPTKSAIEVVNNTPRHLQAFSVTAKLLRLDGTTSKVWYTKFNIAPSSVTTVIKLDPKAFSGKPHFLSLSLHDNEYHLWSRNFYWEPATESPTDLTDLQKLPGVPLNLWAEQTKSGPSTQVMVGITNPTKRVALMAHLQLRRAKSGKRVLPAFYSNNYISLEPGEERVVTIEAEKSDLAGEPPMVTLDGFNVKVGRVDKGSILVRFNKEMTPGPVIPAPPFVPNPPGVVLNLACGQDDLAGTSWAGDESYVRGGFPNNQPGTVDISPAGDTAGPKELYNSERYGQMTYVIPVPVGQKYTVRLHFAELSQLHPGARRFNVAINGQTVLTEFDIFTEAGGGGKLLVKDFPAAPDARGNIVIRFTRGSANEPEVRAIQILRG